MVDSNIYKDATDPQYLSVIRQMLIDRFDLDELRDLCFALGIDYAVFPQWRVGLARELIVHLVKKNKLYSMLESIEELRPDINIPVYLSSTVKTTNQTKPTHKLDPGKIYQSWLKPQDSLPTAPPVVTGQVIILPLKSKESGEALLRALTISEGNTIWELCFDDVEITAVVPFEDDLLVVSLSHTEAYDGEGFLLAVDVTGHEAWRFLPGGQLISAVAISETPVLLPDSVIKNTHTIAAFTVDHRWLQVIDLKVGSLLMESHLSSEASLAAPVFSQERIVIPCLAPTLLAINIEGDTEWRLDIPTLSSVIIAGSPYVIDNSIVLAMTNGTILCLHSQDGTILWEKLLHSRDNQLTPISTDGSKLYIGAGDGVYALNVINGQVMWNTESGMITGRPFIWSDSVTIIEDRNTILILDRYSGQVKWKESVGSILPFGPNIVDGDEKGPYLIVVDNTGHTFAFSIPTSPELHEAAARWERAAVGWEYQGRLRRAAMAWIRQARYLLDEGHALSECANAFKSAERLFTQIGDEEDANNCSIEYSRCLHIPRISLEVEHRGLVKNTWSLLNFSVSNHGFGLARQLVIQVQSKEFEGQVAITQALSNLPPGRTRFRRLDVKPLNAGTAVPLRVEVSYVDESDAFHSFEETIYLAVSEKVANRTPDNLPILTQPEGSRLEQTNQRNAVQIEIRLSSGKDAFSVEVSLDDGHVFTGGKLSKSILAWRPSGSPIDDGKFLFTRLTEDTVVNKAWNIAQGEAIAHALPRRILLRIDYDVPELNVLPWELMHDGTVMLAANSNTPFARYLPVPKSWGQPLVNHPIRILAIISNPLDLHDRYQLNRLDVDLEKYILATAFKELEQDSVRLEFMPSPITPDNLSQILRKGYQIVHFVGHGRFVGHYKIAELFLEDQSGNALPVADETLAQMFSLDDIQPHLVYLSACQSASHSSRDAFVGISAKLVRAGVPAVIGMQERVQIAAARKLTRVFYRRLMKHGYVDQALNEARASLLISNPDALKTPILFMRLASGKLWDFSL